MHIHGSKRKPPTGSTDTGRRHCCTKKSATLHGGRNLPLFLTGETKSEETGHGRLPLTGRSELHPRGHNLMRSNMVAFFTHIGIAVRLLMAWRLSSLNAGTVPSRRSPFSRRRSLFSVILVLAHLQTVTLIISQVQYGRLSSEN